MPGVALAHRHLVRALVGADRRHCQCVADGPSAQEADSELALQITAKHLSFQLPIDRGVDMRRNVVDVRQALFVAG